VLKGARAPGSRLIFLGPANEVVKGIGPKIKTAARELINKRIVPKEPNFQNKDKLIILEVGTL